MTYNPRTWSDPAWYAYCVVCDPYNRPFKLNCRLQDYAVNKGIVFG